MIHWTQLSWCLVDLLKTDGDAADAAVAKIAGRGRVALRLAKRELASDVLPSHSVDKSLEGC